MTKPNPYETTARAKKAWALEHSIARTWDLLPPDERRGRSLASIVEAWDDRRWEIASIKAGTHMPSEQTRALVVSALRLREVPIEDPFVGLV